jgi:two-component system, sensor histidine kinase and response regulator
MNYSILIVDDEPDNFETIEALLESTQYILHYANRGQEAIAALDTFNPDAILLDVMMPGIDGIEVCKRIKAMPQWQAVPIIMVTALDDKADLARCLAAGADDFVSKPINGVELRARVQSMLRIKKQHDRIQSLSRLQRNNIHFLENSLHELHLDLAVSFPTELNVPMHSVLKKVKFLQQHFRELTVAEIDDILASVNRSTLRLDKLNQSFLFYLQLALPSKSLATQVSCAAKSSIEQLVTQQIDKFNPATKLALNIEDAELAVTYEHLQYIILELLDWTLKSFKSEACINIYGHVMEGVFHFYIDNRAASPTDEPSSKLSESIQFDSNFDSETELGIGLKIVKKIIEIYDGLFLISTTKSQPRRSDETTIYITLPLAISPIQYQLSADLIVSDLVSPLEHQS